MPEDHIRKEAGKAFADGVEDNEIKVALLIGVEKTVNEALSQAFELHAVFLASRAHKNSIRHSGGAGRPTRQKNARQSECWKCGGPGHFENTCPYRRKAENDRRQKREDGSPRNQLESPRISEWRPSNEETNRRGGRPSGNEQGRAQKGGRRRIH
jgi:hypothetical protein